MKDKEEYSLANFDFSKLDKILKSNQGLKLPSNPNSNAATVLIFSQHRFYRHLVIELAEAEIAKNGKLKNPFKFLDPLDKVWKSHNPAELKFYTGISRFKNNYNEGRSATDLEALKAITSNPMNLPVYLHDDTISSNITANSIQLSKLDVLMPELLITVGEKNDDFQISGTLKLRDQSYPLQNIKIRFNYFMQVGHQLYLIDNPYILSVIDFFKHQQETIIIPRSEYEDFQEKILSVLEERITVNYSYLKRATRKQVIEQGFDLENEQIIYLSESDNFVIITPVMRYGTLEIPVISTKQIRAKDKLGKMFTLDRDEERELQFITAIAKMHPQFLEQMNEFPEQKHADCFYLHRKHFLNSEWFLESFQAWRSKGIAILGFNQLKENKFSPYRAEISINVISGIDWFETAIKVKFNKQTVALKHLHKSIRNKSKFVQLDDGTIGVLPNEWLLKFQGYFGAGEVIAEKIRTPNINYASVEQLYETEVLDVHTREKLLFYRTKLSNFDAIKPVSVPSELKATLRAYQQEGLNWLNFLDDFNFGACLADDMGLGKTIQILAFILSQRKKTIQNTNLVVVPASLVFNWQQEIQRFAPTLKLKTIYGSDRTRLVDDFENYEVILTSYGTLLSDISFLKNYRFNYIFLDESQTIKNPDSQRYKAVRLLHSRNKVALTGTPIENNTFDLYGQLSFACPGLLGSREQFKRLYSVPIDQFKDSKRAGELQQKINPFVLRRTKEQVAKELPDKTEMIIFCEMGIQQREIYDAARDEIRDYLMGTAEDELKKSSMHVLQGITRLRQICNSPAILNKDAYFGDASAKMDVLMEQIEGKSLNHKILVFSQFVTMLDLVRAELDKRNISSAYLTGQTKNRSEVVDSFQFDPGIRVFLISLKAGGIGLNLTQADYVYLVDPWWNPAVENQAVDRAYRIGQKKNVMAIRLICPDTIEEKIMLMQESKKDLATNLIKTEMSIFKSLSKTDLLKLL
ncbi:MAG: SNF2-related protein [Bacteroidota bacterium]